MKSKSTGCSGSADCPAGKVCVGGSCVSPPREILPRATSIADCGYQDKLHGWFDVQGQGAKNDYCRYIGDGKFICKLAGSNAEYAWDKVVDAAKVRASCDSTGTLSCSMGGSTAGCGQPLWS
ncbi:MAG: hypothetical protein KGL39_10545 [Patescibacteria group bacterium]|nr:hypothetical protein [Patescibacteria group bacterium]